MIIGVAGKYSANSEDERTSNLDAMNKVAAVLLEQGHIPVIGVNAALPVIEQARVDDKYKSIMEISLAVINTCEALLIISESKGVLMERDLILSKGLPVYYSLEEVPQA